MTWFKATITESCILGGAFHRLCREFQRAFISAGAPADMALFAQTFVLGDSREIFFSPGSIPYVAELVRLFDGRPCAAPDVNDLTMVYGVPGSTFPAELIAAQESTSPATRKHVAMAR
jgi:hypothetical protein